MFFYLEISHGFFSFLGSADILGVLLLGPIKRSFGRKETWKKTQKKPKRFPLTTEARSAEGAVDMVCRALVGERWWASDLRTSNTTAHLSGRDVFS